MSQGGVHETTIFETVSIAYISYQSYVANKQMVFFWNVPQIQFILYYIAAALNPCI